MKVTTSLRKMCKHCQKIKRKGKSYVICKAVSFWCPCSRDPPFVLRCLRLTSILAIPPLQAPHAHPMPALGGMCLYCSTAVLHAQWSLSTSG